MPRVCLLAIPILTASTLAWNAVAQNTPGAIPDPGSYQGSMELQRRKQESAAQIQQQNEQMQQLCATGRERWWRRSRGAPERQTPAAAGEERTPRQAPSSRGDAIWSASLPTRATH